MKHSTFSNIKQYKEVEHKLSSFEEPIISISTHKEKVKEKIATLLNYEGFGQVQVPGSFLSVVLELTSLPVTSLIEILDISRSTFYRVKDETMLEPNAIDKISTILKIYNRGIKAFDSKDDFIEWLDAKIPTLEDKKPLDLLYTENGRAAVLDAIDRIEYGIYG